MKSIHLIIYTILFLHTGTIYAGIAPGKARLNGKITSKTTGEAIIGATVYFPDLKTGAVAALDGTYSIDNLPTVKTLVQVKELGYKTFVQVIDLSVTKTLDVVLEESAIEANEVVITGTSKSTEIKRSPIPIIPINHAFLQQNSGTNIIDVIAKVPGVSALTTGPNVSKPYIHGLGYNRVLTLYDGIRQEGQQWGDEHGIEVDQNTVDRVEVVKGPASLIYGSDAMAGVVNLLPANPVPAGAIKGEVMTNYQSNNGLFAGSASVAGNNNGLVWNARFSRKQAKDYENKYDGRVYGTAFKETDFNAGIGVNKSWGYSHLNFSSYDDLQEIPDGSRDSATRKFTRQITEADTYRRIVGDGTLNSYKIADLHQHVQYSRLYSANSFFIGESKLDIKLGYQQNVRREFSHPEAIDVAGLYLILNTENYDVKWYLPEYHGIETTLGANGMYQQNTNSGTEFIIPDYHLFDIGPFAMVKRSFNKWDISGGVRFDTRMFSNNAMYVKTDPATGFDTQVSKTDATGAAMPFQGYKHTYSGLSGSIGATYEITDNVFLKANVSRGFRAPSIFEISANGVHPGTNIYQLGSPNFNPEFGLQEDVGLFFSTAHVSGSMELFNNSISNYIYNEKVLNSKGGDSVIVAGNQTFQFQAAQAQLYGGEFSLDIHPHPIDWLHFENSAAWVTGMNKGGKGIVINDSNKYLPNIPPFHTNSELRADIGKKYKYLSKIYVKVGVEYFAAQNQAFLANNTETKTPGYTLLNAGFGANITNSSGKTVCIVNVSGSNLADLAYQSNMSRLKYMDNYPVNYTGRSGIYNMGRNISFKLIIPIDIRKGA